MRRPLAYAIVALVGSAALLGIASGCENVLGLQRAELLVDGGLGASTSSGSGSQSTASASMSSASGTGGSGATTGTGAGSGGAMPCAAGSTMPCYSGPKGTVGVGTCKGGTATCTEEGQWGACEGETVPQPRSCASTQDVACLGKDNCTQWAELFGSLTGASATSVGVDGKGNVFVSGVFSGSIVLPTQTLTAKSGADLFLLKLDPTGTPIWGKSFTGGMPFGPPAVLPMSVDVAGDVALSGQCAGAYSFDGKLAGNGFWVTKLSGNGTVLWAEGLTANCTGTCGVGAAVALTPSGDVVIGGTVAKSSIDFGDGPITVPGEACVVAKLRGSDGSGKAADGGWNQILSNGTNFCEVTGVAVDGTSNVLLAADFEGGVTLGTGADLFTSGGAINTALGKLAQNGAAIWLRQIGNPNGNNQTAATALGIDGTGGPIVAGTFTGNVDFGSGMPTMGPDGGAGYVFVAHYGSDQAYKWSTSLQNGTINGVTGDAAGNVFLTGSFTGSLDLGGAGPLMGKSGIDVFVAKLTGTGSLLWSKAYGMSGDQAAEVIALTPQGAPVIAGYTLNPIDFGLGVLTPAAMNGNTDAFVAELSP